jgi:hypothetical protein
MFCKYLNEQEKASAFQGCDKGMIMFFLCWDCENYLAKKRLNNRKKKSANQYWRDFKLLYRRANSVLKDNDPTEIVEV